MLLLINANQVKGKFIECAGGPEQRHWCYIYFADVTTQVQITSVMQANFLLLILITLSNLFPRKCEFKYSQWNPCTLNFHHQ